MRRSSPTGEARPWKTRSPSVCRPMCATWSTARPSRSTRPTMPRATSCPMWRAGCAWASAGCVTRCIARGRVHRRRRSSRSSTRQRSLRWTPPRIFIRRYADLADRQAEACDDAGRRQELRAIAERCRRLSTEPAQDFWDALQAVWFLFTLLQIESNASSFSPGRFDQYMLPYLQQRSGFRSADPGPSPGSAGTALAQVQRGRAAAQQQ